MGHQFILHILLSMGRFETVLDLTLHENLREVLRYARLIEGKNDKDSLIMYAKQLTQKFIEEQLVSFPNAYRVLDTYINLAAQWFDVVIFHDLMPIVDLPPFLQSNLNTSIEQKIVNHWKSTKRAFVEAALTEIGSHSVELNNIPSQVEFDSASIEQLLDWDADDSFTKGPHQSDQSFVEQRTAIAMNVAAIDNYLNICSDNGGSFVKCVGARGAPRSGK